MKKRSLVVVLCATLLSPILVAAQTPETKIEKRYLWIEVQQLLSVDATVIEFSPTAKERHRCSSAPESMYQFTIGIDRKERGEAFNIWVASKLSYGNQVLVLSADVDVPFMRDADTSARVKATHPLPQSFYFLITTHRAQVDYLMANVDDAPMKKKLFSCTLLEQPH